MTSVVIHMLRKVQWTCNAISPCGAKLH